MGTLSSSTCRDEENLRGRLLVLQCPRHLRCAAAGESLDDGVGTRMG